MKGKHEMDGYRNRVSKRADVVCQSTGEELPEPEHGAWIRDASKEDILAILDNAPCGIVVNKAIRGEVLYLNRKAVEIGGYGLSDFPTAQVAANTVFPDPKERRRVIKEAQRDIPKGNTTVVFKSRS